MAFGYSTRSLSQRGHSCEGRVFMTLPLQRKQKGLRSRGGYKDSERELTITMVFIAEDVLHDEMEDDLWL